jgi:hypothetical protein
MADAVHGAGSKPATAARIYDFHLGGTHNFPADREAAMAVAQMFPRTPAIVRTNRAFLRRAVRHLADLGVRQFLDIGSGIPTEGNVHEVAPMARVAYVDIDPVAVAEGLEILEGNDRAIALRADLRDPQAILNHPQVRQLLDFEQPIGLLLFAVLHFVPDDAEAYDVVEQLLAAVAPGSYLALSHAATETDLSDDVKDDVKVAQNVYKRQTATPFTVRTQSEIAQFFTGLEFVEPGLVWLPEWRPAPGDPVDFRDEPAQSSGLGGVARLA